MADRSIRGKGDCNGSNGKARAQRRSAVPDDDDDGLETVMSREGDGSK